MKENVIRALGFYEPFGSLMLHGKIETRWVREGMKPPFPLGKYLFYATKNPCSSTHLLNWSGTELMMSMVEILGSNDKLKLNGYAIGTGLLWATRPLLPGDKNTFVKFVGRELRKDKNGIEHWYIQWALFFREVKPIEPFKWEFGKQGVGFVPDSELSKIKVI